MIDRKFIGKKFGPLSVDVEKGQLRFFSKAIGEDNPIYLEVAAAREAGYRSLPAPPTFGFSLALLAKKDPFAHFEEMGIDLGKVLHGEQKFEYYDTICAGDKISLEETIIDIHSKKGGILEFLISETLARNQFGNQVLKMVCITVVRN